MTREEREEYAKLHKESGDLLTLCAKDKRAQTGEEQTAQAARYARLDQLKAQHDAEREHAKRAFEAGTLDAGKEPGTPADSAAKKEFARNGGDAGTGPELKPDSAEYAKAHYDAINHFLRTGEGNAKFVITSGTSVLVPKKVLGPTIIRRNINAFRLLLAATGFTPIETSDTSQLVLPVFDDTSNAGNAPAENATADVTADVATTASVTLNATLYQGKSRWLSNTVLNANSFDVLAYMIPILSKAVDKAQESAWTTTMMGLAGTAPTFTNASKAALTYAELLNWEHTLAVAYRDDAGFMLSDSLYRVIRGLVDNNNRPVMDLDPTNEFQTTIHGKPVAVSDYMGVVGTANGVAGAFVCGDAIKIRDVMPQRLTRYTNVPQYPDQTGYNLFANGDCQFVTAGMALLKLAAS